jgi:hypothetical protein
MAITLSPIPSKSEYRGCYTVEATNQITCKRMIWSCSNELELRNILKIILKHDVELRGVATFYYNKDGVKFNATLD